MSTESQPESSASPYGPADTDEPAATDQSGLEAMFGEHAAVAEGTDAVDPVNASAVEASVPDAPWVDRGRRLIRTITLVTGALSLFVLVIVLVSSALGHSVLSSAGSDVGNALIWIATLASPVLFVVALNLLTWRGLLRSIARKRRAEAIVLVSLTGVGMAVASIAAVFALLLGGFFVTAILA